MKIILAALGVTAIIGCGSSKEIQVDMVRAKVIKTDTVYRYPEYVKQVTWKDEDNMQYVSFIPIYDRTCIVGMSMYLLRRK
jgi:hypothetical protein